MSEAEPELGIGFVRSQDQQSVTLEFSAVGQTRRYGKRSAPLKRIEFRVGDTVQTKKGEKWVVERVETKDSLNWFISGDRRICETELSPNLKLQRPLTRLLTGQWDPLPAFELRRQTLERWHELLGAPSRGLIGPRAQLLAHQLYVVSQIAGRGLPRALLADEVGLGKTIEASWILHQLMTTGRVQRVLVIVPRSLLNQWFIELLRRFNYSFWVPESQSEDGVLPGDFAMHERVIVSLESLRVEGLGEALVNVGWDMVIVDEAHRVKWDFDEPSLEYSVLERLASISQGLLLLTATPEQLGLEGHFARLRLIDPVRFPSWESFCEEHEKYQDIVRLADKLLSNDKPSPKDLNSVKKLLQGKVSSELLANLEDQEVRRKVLAALVDYYGTGRVYFRNSRQVVELEHCFFPKRILKAHEIESDTFVQWLGDFCRSHRQEKTLLIASSAKKVIELEKRLRDDFGIRAVSFHENQPLLVRDRNAAYFEDPEGATILLSSEIGGEGRNFQHAKHLVLGDMPEDPDILEQRIGRLDRIGQSSDITIHAPYSPGSREEALLRWHLEVFSAFESPTQGGGVVFEIHREKLHDLVDNPKRGKAFEALLTQAKRDYLQIRSDVEAGRDRLIEINSFDASEGTHLVEMLSRAERPKELREYLEKVFDLFGLHVEDLDSDSIFVEAGDSAFASYVPALPIEGQSLTFSRTKALARDDLTFVSWDHPLVTETMEAVTRQEAGNVSIATWNPNVATKPEYRTSLLIECYFAFEPVAEGKWNANEFLPAKPLRIVVDSSGGNQSAAWPTERIRTAISPIPSGKAHIVNKLPADVLRGILEKARLAAEREAETLRKKSFEAMNIKFDAEILRLEALQSKNKMVGDLEIQWWKERRLQLTNSYRGARIRLDSFLMILPGGLFS